jgi:DNA-binding CsgD family transcriptional regulator
MGAWYFMGDLREGRRWLDLALGVEDVSDTRLKAAALRRAATLAHSLGEDDACALLIERALVSAEQSGDEHGVAEALLVAGSVAIDRGEAAAACVAIARGLELAEQGDDAALVAKLQNRLAIFSAFEGGRLVQVLEESILTLRQGANERELGLSLLNLSFCYLVAERPTEALTAIAEALEILERLGERSYLGVARLTEGLTQLRLGDIDESRRMLTDGTSTARDTGNVEDMLYGLEASAEWLGVTGHHSDAVTLWSASHQIRLDRDVPTHPVDQAWIAAGRARDERGLRPDRLSAVSASGTILGLESALDEANESLRSAHIPDASAQTNSAAPDRFAPTPRELEVLALLVDGCSDGEIAERLFISPKTASVHVANLKGKLGANSRVEIATLAMRRGLASPSIEEPPG